MYCVRQYIKRYWNLILVSIDYWNLKLLYIVNLSYVVVMSYWNSSPLDILQNVSRWIGIMFVICIAYVHIMQCQCIILDLTQSLKLAIYMYSLLLFHLFLYLFPILHWHHMSKWYWNSIVPIKVQNSGTTFIIQ